MSRNTPDKYPTITPQLPGNTYEKTGYLRHDMPVHLSGNRSDEYVSSYSEATIKALMLPTGITASIANIGTWVLGAAFTASVVKVLPMIVTCGVVVSLVMFLGYLMVFMKFNPQHQELVMMRIVTILLGGLLGVIL